MAKVKMKTLAAGPKFVARAGDVVDVDKEQAKELVAGGYAEPVTGKPESKETDSDGSEEDGSADGKPDHARGSKKAS